MERLSISDKGDHAWPRPALRMSRPSGQTTAHNLPWVSWQSDCTGSFGVAEPVLSISMTLGFN